MDKPDLRARGCHKINFAAFKCHSDISQAHGLPVQVKKNWALSAFPFVADNDCVVPLNSNYLCFQLKL